MTELKKNASYLTCGAVLAGAAFAMGAMHTGVAHADSVKADASTASSVKDATVATQPAQPTAASNAGLASSSVNKTATPVASVLSNADSSSAKVASATPATDSTKDTAKAPVASAPATSANTSASTSAKSNAASSSDQTTKPATQADDSFSVPADGSNTANDGQNGLSGVKQVTSNTATSKEVTQATVSYIDSDSNVVQVAHDTVDYSSNPVNQDTANKIAQSTVPAGYKVDKVYYSGSHEGLADGEQIEHLMTIKAIVSQANEGLVLEDTTTDGSATNNGMTLTPAGNTDTSSSNSAPVKVVINYQLNGQTIGTVNTTTDPNTPVDVSKNCPAGYQVSSSYDASQPTKVVNGVATLTVPVEKASTTTTNGTDNVEVTIQYTDNGKLVKTATQTVADKGTVDVEKDLPSGYEVQPGWQPGTESTNNGKVTMVVPVVQANASLQPDNSNSSNSSTTPSGNTNGSATTPNNSGSNNGSSTTNPDNGSSSTTTPSNGSTTPSGNANNGSSTPTTTTPSDSSNGSSTTPSNGSSNTTPNNGSSADNTTPSGNTSSTNTPSNGSTAPSGNTNSSSNTPAGNTNSSSTPSGSTSTTPSGNTNNGSETVKPGDTTPVTQPSTNTPSGNTNGNSTAKPSDTTNNSSNTVSSTTGNKQDANSSSTPAADTVSITVNGKPMTEKVGDDASLEKLAESLHVPTTTPGHYVYTIQQSDGKSVVSVADPFAGTKWVASNNGLKINIVGFSKAPGGAPATEGKENTDNKDIYPGEGILSNGHQQSSTSTDGTIQSTEATGQSSSANNNASSSKSASQAGSANAVKAQAGATGLSAEQQANVSRDEANGTAAVESNSASASQIASAVANGASLQSQPQEGSGSSDNSGLPDTGAGILGLALFAGLGMSGVYLVGKKRRA